MSDTINAANPQEEQNAMAASAALVKLQDQYTHDLHELQRQQTQEIEAEQTEREHREQERDRIAKELDQQDQLNWEKAQHDLQEQLPRIRQRAVERVVAEGAAAERQLRRMQRRVDRLYHENKRFVSDVFGWRAGKRKAHYDRIRPLEDEEQALIQVRATKVREKALADLSRKLTHDIALNNIAFHSQNVQNDTEQENRHYNHRKAAIDSDFYFEWTVIWGHSIVEIHNRITAAEREIERNYKDKLRLIYVRRRRRGQAGLALDIDDAPENVADDAYMEIIEQNETPDKPRNKARENIRATHNYIRKMIGPLPWIERTQLCTVLSVNATTHRCTVRTAGAIAIDGDPDAGSRPMVINNVKFGFHPPTKDKEYVLRVPGAYRDNEVAYPPGLPWIKVPGSDRLVYQSAKGIVAGIWPPDQEEPPLPTVLITANDLGREGFMGVDGKNSIWTKTSNGANWVLRQWPDLGAGGRSASTEHIVSSDVVDSILYIDNTPGSDAILGQKHLDVADAILADEWAEQYPFPGAMIVESHGGGPSLPDVPCCSQGLSPGLNASGGFTHSHPDDTVTVHNHYGYVHIPGDEGSVTPQPSTHTASYMIYLTCHAGEGWVQAGRVDQSSYPIERETFHYSGFAASYGGALDLPIETNLEAVIPHPSAAYVAGATACGGCGGIFHGWTGSHDSRIYDHAISNLLVDNPYIWSTPPSDGGVAGAPQGPAYIAVDEPEAVNGHLYFALDPVPYNPLTDFGRVLAQGWTLDDVRSLQHIEIVNGETLIAGFGNHPLNIMAMGFQGSMIMWANDQAGRDITIHLRTSKGSSTRPSYAGYVPAQTYDLGHMLQFMYDHRPIPWEYTVDYGEHWLQAKADPAPGIFSSSASILPDATL